MTVTPMYQIDWILRIVRIEISFRHCKKNSYRLKLRCNNHLSLQLRHELRETSLSRRLTNAVRVSPQNVAEGGMVAFWWERKTQDRDPGKNPSMYRKESRPTVPFSTRRICSRAASLSFVSIAHHVSKSDAYTKTLRANLGIQYSSFNSVMKGELPQCSPGYIVINLYMNMFYEHQPIYMNMFYDNRLTI